LAVAYANSPAKRHCNVRRSAERSVIRNPTGDLLGRWRILKHHASIVVRADAAWAVTAEYQLSASPSDQRSPGLRAADAAPDAAATALLLLLAMLASVVQQ
jgi:hypothetical protein